VLRRQVTRLRLAAVAMDLGVAVLTFLLVAALRFRVEPPAGPPPTGIWPLGAAVAWAVVWVAVLWVRGLYARPLDRSWRRELLAVGSGAVLTGLLVLSALFLARLVDVSRLFLLLLFPIGCLVTLASHAAFHRLQARVVTHAGGGGRRLLMVGSGPEAAAFLARVRARPALGLVPVGRLRGDADPPEPADGGAAGRALRATPVLGELGELDHVLRTQVIDEVAVCLEPADAGALDAIVARCREEGRACHVPVGAVPLPLEDAVMEQLDGLAVASVLPRPDHAAGLLVKRGVDIVLGAMLLLLALPLLAILAMGIRLIDGGPVLFRQDRIGRHGRPFRMLKLRTMTADAEERLADLAPLNLIQGSAFKLERDPRLTRTGPFLRRTSLDELPQLWNVLRGEMSLVGPRPPLPEEVAAYDAWHRRRLSVSPGMTGLWQVEGRQDPVFDHWVRLDLVYIDGWSLRLDVVILLRTIPAVLGGGGR
jgi:exopolysaccharide biosynthesis polyprenyl glycosylphosphotransferase